ncbi:hypothetical protein [Paenibacillus roseipurpureus]|uniref:Uncharacterized protein n=1 Tax=Paenibacillus roseopurpureus TaxID=2918901 RepID=A0AA96LR63_9BACL|nr:hypothetical protein [Paenibacillus sp. MBLB1832]WNR45704.1 hypothetical protein MJB10_06275 [Paenibacillus sp. MBLB1832]
MLKKIIASIAALALIVVVLLFIVIQYVKPTESLDLTYREISISNKIADIILSRKLEVRLTEDDINQLLKKQLADHSTLPHDFRLEGAKLNMAGSLINADVNLRWQNKIPIGAHAMFFLSWESPNLVIQHQSTQIKSLQLPSEWLQMAPVEIPLQSYLPKLIGIKNVVFEDKAIVVQLKALQ